ncbi:MAG: retroviral-like aspartic protease family protein [Candidatus Omnitrophica bacterium]|nr:retroviral-like aspartic protease family protein [Candidatus Omnitrophota bacterium]
MNRYAPIFFLIFILFTQRLAADTVELENGKVIVGAILSETESAVVISKQGGDFVYSISRERIRNIRKSTEGEIVRQRRAEQKTYLVDKKVDEIKKGELDAYRKERYKTQVENAKKARGRIKIKFADGRFGVVDALINKNGTSKLLVDTGASMVVITRAAANRLGIEVVDDMGKISVVLADGSMTKAIPVVLDSVKVGHSEVKNVKAAISETSPGDGLDGLLGMTFLRYFHVKLDSNENCLVLEKY